MSAPLQRVILDHRGLDYLRSQLSEVRGIGTLVNDHAAWTSGDVWTWLPEGVELDRLYRFEEGELLAINTKARIERTSAMVPVTSLKDDSVEAIMSCLHHAGPYAFGVFEHPMLKPGEGPDFIRSMSVNFDDTIFSPLKKTASFDKIQFAFN